MGIGDPWGNLQVEVVLGLGGILVFSPVWRRVRLTGQTSSVSGREWCLEGKIGVVDKSGEKVLRVFRDT